MATPLVLLDVDGVLNPFSRPHRGYRRHRCTPEGITYRLWLNAAHGPLLLDLAEGAGAELAWASFWKGAANEWIAPRVGLPEMPFVPIPRFPGLEEGHSLGAWKARHVAPWTKGRPFVWFEDEPDATVRIAAEKDIGPHLLVAVDSETGLTGDHLDRAADWLAALTR
ncbi:HAD domain-containing protein [Actinomadura flavalba]|uniref:HAD domain-containing protein n=1 Tax=Actinomadura flavalba TaxID=1120938 RepID=UPI0003623C6F|nr:HAD domain-containing protein [Actinomadura flavalba]